MKIYWLMCQCEDDPVHKCFFRETENEIQHEVKVREDDQKDETSICYQIHDNTRWWYEEEEISESEFGYCINSKEPYEHALARCPDCSVGMIRKMRNGVENDDGMCGSCPYYFDHYPKEDEV
jgi:hypothetical protein